MRWVALFLLSGCSSILGIEDFSVGDAGADSSGETGFCLGPAGDWRVCVPSEPTMSRDIAVATIIGTDGGGLCETNQPAGWVGRQPAACFVLATNVTVSATLRAEGARPLVLFASKKITISGGGIDVAGHRTQTVSAAGANATQCNPPTAPTGGGGGAGGSFTTKGGDGGRATTTSTIGQAANRDLMRPMRLRGGCAGGDGGIASGNAAGKAGEGGGAIYLVAGEGIEINGAFVNASGASGSGAFSPSGGGGGGTGGMIVIYAPVISGLGGHIMANGGGGGGGGGGGVAGEPGSEASSTDSTMMPQGGPGGGTGGMGGAGFPGDINQVQGAHGAVGGGSSGGGGGGGAAGFVMVPAGNSLASSPASATFP